MTRGRLSLLILAQAISMGPAIAQQVCGIQYGVQVTIVPLSPMRGTAVI
jgi:hypothetical protein